MAKTAARKSKTTTPEPIVTDAPKTAPKAEPYVVDVEEIHFASVRLKMHDGTTIDLIAAGGMSNEANRQLRGVAVEALRNSLVR